MWDDLRQAIRSLRKQPGFTAVAVLTLAFGIGVNASLFSLVNALFLQPIRVKDPQQLVLVMQRGEIVPVPYGHSFPDYLDYRASASVFSELVAYMPTPVHLSAGAQAPERTWVEVVSPNYFALAGAAAAFGELLRPGEGESRGAAPEIVLSYTYWQRRFGGNPSIVGQPITLNGKTFTVIGIAARTFNGLSWAMAVSAWIPAGALGSIMNDGDNFRENRGVPAWRLMGRLTPGTTLADARAQVDVIGKRLAAAFPAEHKGTRALVIPENRARPDPSVSDYLPVFVAVFAAMVTLVLFIACANVANLMLSRAFARQRDLVIRSALGASRARLVRLQMMEGLVLAALAGIVGLLLARWAGQTLSGFMPAGDIPVNQDHPWDWRVYMFTILAAGIAGVITGLWPARQASGFNLIDGLKEGSSAAGTSRHTLRNLLVIGQVSLSMIVLVSAGLFLHSLQQMQTVAVGMRTDRLIMMSVDLGLQQYTDTRGRQFLEALLTRAEALPGVLSATTTVHVPLDYGMQFNDVGIDGGVPGTKDGYLSVAFTVVGPSFLETTGGLLVRGRGLDRTDDERSRMVAMVNETMARKLWPGQDALAKRFRLGRDGDWTEVVGIVRDGKYLMLGEEPRPYFYVPLSQRYRSPVTLMVRTASDPAAQVAPLQRLLRNMDRDLPVYNVRTMDAHVRDSVFGLMPMRMGAAIAGSQGLIGLLLAVMGLYAVVSYAVTRRTREIGVRMALGADRTDVMRLVVREGMRLTVIGVVIGLLVSVALGAALSRVLYGVSAMDAGVYGVVTVVLLGVSALACYLPARRATQVDPLIALRAD
jgi:predicted permease